MKKVKIYCLYDPETCKIRYIGRTTKKVLSHRLIEHITKSRYYKTYRPNSGPSHKEAWILSLLNKGIEPKIKFLCEIDGWKESHIFERSLINKYKDNRDLVNYHDRGEGGMNQIVREESKKQISESLKRYYRNNMSSSNKIVYSLDKKDNILREFNSGKEAAEYHKILPSKVTGVIKCKYKQWKGVIYSRNKNIEPIKKIKRLLIKNRKEVIVDNIILGKQYKFSGIQAAEQYFGFPEGTIRQTLKTKTQLYKGKYKFIINL